jgi:hypothetical protein
MQRPLAPWMRDGATFKLLSKADVIDFSALN